MTTQAEIDQARAAGARAASQAQAIADAADPSLLDRVEAGAQSIWEFATDNSPFNLGYTAGTQAGKTIAAGAQDVLKPADEALNILKWIGIVILVFVALLAFLWLAFAVFGFVWAGKLLRDIAPSLAPAAVAIARASR